MRRSGARDDGCCGTAEAGVVSAFGRTVSGFLWALTVWAAILVVALSAGVAWGCPNCKDGIAATESAEAAAIARGYALSILIMLAMPFTLAGSFGLYVWREMRRLDREPQDGLAASRDGTIGGGTDEAAGALHASAKAPPETVEASWIQPTGPS